LASPLAPRQNNTNLFCRHAHNTEKKGRENGGGKAEEILFNQGKATAQNLSTARKFRLSRGYFPFFTHSLRKLFSQELYQKVEPVDRGGVGKRMLQRGAFGSLGGVAMPKECIVHPKVLIHLPWHNFIHSGFVVELKVWPATGITNYKKIV